MNPIATRLLNQQLSSPQFSDPADVVRHMGAIQAQEYRMMRWAVAMRTRKPSSRAFKLAFDNGQIIRLHLMRGTWQLVAAEDYWPLLQLCAPKAISVIHGWMRSNHVSIGDDELARIRDILVQTAADMGSAVKEDFAHALAARGISIDDHRLSYHLRISELEGILCSGELLPMKATYALAEHKVGPRVPVDRDEALLLLARKYFHSRQPATLEDFVWWSGLNIGHCRRGIELMGDAIHKMKWKGRDFYVTEDCRTRGFRKGRYLLIPQNSILYGKYNSSISYAQSRAQIVWERLIRPDGYALDLGGQNASDAKGASGVKGFINDHPLAYVKAILLMSVFSAVNTEFTGVGKYTDNQYAQNAAANAQQITAQLGEKLIDRAMNVQPTIKIPAGKKINIITNQTFSLPPVPMVPVTQRYIRQ